MLGKLFRCLKSPKASSKQFVDAPAKRPYSLPLRQADLRDLSMIKPGLGADIPAASISPCLSCRFYNGGSLRCVPNPVGTMQGCKQYALHLPSDRVLDGTNLYSLIYLDGDWIEVSKQAGYWIDKLLQSGQPLPEEFGGIQPNQTLQVMTLAELKLLTPGRPGIAKIVERIFEQANA